MTRYAKNFFCLLFVLFFSATYADAAPLDALLQALSPYQEAQGDFSQELLDQNHQVLMKSSGKFALSRPLEGEQNGCFYWRVLMPNAQTLVATGEKIYFYDEALKQVTVQKQHAAKMNNPAMLLSGKLDTIGMQYQVEQQKKGDEISFKLLPKKSQEAFFSSLVLVFKKNILNQMSIEDNLGQETRIIFSHVNNTAPPALFKFSLPKNVDVVSSL